MSLTGVIQDLAKQSGTTILHEGWPAFFRKAIGVARAWIFGARFKLDREDIAGIYLKGAGIEIGALNAPLKVPSSATVKYVDRLSLPELRKEFPELASKKLADVHIIDDGEKLLSVSDSTQDFVIGNHFIEHCENPVEAFRNMLRVLRIGGVIYLSIPDKRYTFDVDRPVTSTEHILKDYEQGPVQSRRGHCEEWARLVDKTPEAQVEGRIAQLLRNETNLHYHYHVWTQTEILEMVLSLKKTCGFNFEVELFYKNGQEAILILRKDGSA